jgi:phosphoglycerate kinase
MQKEIDFLGNAVENPVRPFVAILGGAKVADKLNVISNLLEKCDTLIIGGGMAYTFLKAKGYEIGKSLLDDTKIDYCKEMIAKAEKLGKQLLLPVDTVVTSEFPNPIDAEIATEVVAADAIPQTRWAWISDRKPSNYILMLLRQLRQLYGTDRWVYSRTRFSQQEQRL